MIKKKKHITSKHLRSMLGFWVIMLIGLTFSACGNSKKVTESNIYTQRKLFKETFHKANSEKIIGHYEKAIALFEHCLTIETNNPAAHFALSDLYEKQGNEEKTLQHAEQAYNASKQNKWYILRLADLYFDREEYGKTADLYAEIIEEEKNVDLKFKYVDALIRSDRNAEAIKMLDEIEVETGKIPQVSFTKHDLLIGLGKYEEAEKELFDLMEENPTDSDYKIYVAEFYMQKNDLDKSKQIIEDVLKNDPDYGQAYIMMADLHLRQDNVKEAFKNLEKGFKSENVEIDRKLEILRGLIPYTAKGERDFKEMKQGVNDLFLIIYNPDLANHKLHDYYGYFWLTQENYKKAETQYQMACNIDPSVFNAWLQLLNVQTKLENYNGVYENGQKAVDLFPAQPILYLLTGIGAKKIKEFEPAEEWLFLGKDLVVQDPQLQSEFLYQLGDLNYLQGNTDEGKFYFSQAIQTFEGNINVYADNATRLMKDDKIDLAEAEILKGIKVAPKSTKLLDLYGQILFQKKEYKSAADAFVKALYNNSSDSAILERYADALFFTDEKDKAVELWGEAIKLGNKSAVLKRKFDNRTYYKPE